MWAGALAGVGLAILLGIIFICLFYVAQQQVFKGNGRTLFEAFLMLIASALITLLAMMMLKYKGYEQKWQAKLQKASDAQVPSPCMELRLHIIMWHLRSNAACIGEPGMQFCFLLWLIDNTCHLSGLKVPLQLQLLQHAS